MFIIGLVDLCEISDCVMCKLGVNIFNLFDNYNYIGYYKYKGKGNFFC